MNRALSDTVPGLTKRPNMRKLQRLIDKAAKTSAANYYAERALAEYTEEIYGCTWSDVDGDQIIDSVCGGTGASSGLDAASFDLEMRQCIEAKGY